MSDQEPAVVVKDLYKTFKLPHDQHSGIKQLLVNFNKRDKGYELQRVLNGVSFEIKKGEFFGIVGRNGSGKSTLLKLLAGIYAPDKGLVQVNGSLTPFIELGVGFNPELTGRENVFLNGALLGFSRSEMEAMYPDIVEFAELDKFMDQKLKNYSSGMQVRLAFSIAIRAQSDILLLDEVLAVGDEAFQRKCYQYFQSLKANKKTVILVTHDMGAVEKFCDRALLISGGEVQLVSTAKRVAEEYSLLNTPKAEHKSGNSNKKASPSTKSVPARVELMNLKATPENSGLSDAIELTFTARNNSKTKKKIVCGINIHKVNDTYNSLSLEFNSYSQHGDTVIEPLSEALFKLCINPGQLSRGSYLVRPHFLDVDDNYQYHGSEVEQAIIHIDEADVSKSGSFNLSGAWEINDAKI